MEMKYKKFDRDGRVLEEGVMTPEKFESVKGRICPDGTVYKAFTKSPKVVAAEQEGAPIIQPAQEAKKEKSEAEAYVEGLREQHEGKRVKLPVFERSTALKNLEPKEQTKILIPEFMKGDK